jgi:hypothetical protein
VLVGTWNVNEMKPSRPGLQLWLTERAKSAQLVMIGLQVQCNSALESVDDIGNGQPVVAVAPQNNNCVAA